MTLTGKVALVTGGAGGIGRAAGLAFAAAGARVVIADMNRAGGDETVRLIAAQGGEAAFVQTDVTQAAQVEAMVTFAVERFGRLDCAFNNAGVGGEVAGIHEASEEVWDRVLAVNAKGVWLCLKYEIPALLAGGGGAIVNMASVAGLLGSRGMAAYVDSKHAVVGLTRTAAVEYARAGIRVNAVCPAFIRTDMIEPLTGGTEDGEKQLVRGIPLKRVGTPEEVAGAVVWLCSAAASFVTGQAVAVDGGLSAQ